MNLHERVRGKHMKQRRQTKPEIKMHKHFDSHLREIDSETEDGNRQIECEAEMREGGRERGGEGGESWERRVQDRRIHGW